MISELRHKYPLLKLLKLAGLSRSTYYYHCIEKPDKYILEKQEIARIYTENGGRYGYRRILYVLKQNGYHLNHKTVLKLMQFLQIQGKQRRSKYRSYKGNVGKVAPNLLNRDFSANTPYTKMVTDVTEFAVCNEKIYLSPVMDLFNREILSYTISRSPNFEQTRGMLNKLFEVLPNGVKPILHSDQGWQYQMRIFQQMLKEHNIAQSMSRKGNCLDNSSMENFFGRLKVEMYYGEEFNTTKEFIQKLEEYIEYYNNKRISLKLKGLSPVQYRTQYEGKTN